MYFVTMIMREGKVMKYLPLVGSAAVTYSHMPTVVKESYQYSVARDKRRIYLVVYGTHEIKLSQYSQATCGKRRQSKREAKQQKVSKYQS